MLKTKKTPELRGIFAPLCQEFIEYKQALGFKYKSETKLMSRFSKFSDVFGAKEPVLTKELVEAWITKRPHESDKSKEHRHSIIRQFANYLNGRGYTAHMAARIHYHGSKNFIPYIFTHEEIEKIFKNSDNIQPKNVSPYIHKILPLLFRMLYGCGLRISEALQLTYGDVDLKQGILTIRHAKFDQDRLIPMSDSLTEACKIYCATMNFCAEDYLFPARNKSQISPLTIYNRFREILWLSKIPYNGSGNGPRLHDIRHTFAVHTLQQWVKDGHDLYCMLPILSVYLGHQNTSSTGRYLRLTAEIYPEIVDITSQSCGYIIPTLKTIEKVGVQ